MKKNFAFYLKHENAIKALLRLLYDLKVVKWHETRFGPIRPISEGEMELFYDRMYNIQRE